MISKNNSSRLSLFQHKYEYHYKHIFWILLPLSIHMWIVEIDSCCKVWHRATSLPFLTFSLVKCMYSPMLPIARFQHTSGFALSSLSTYCTYLVCTTCSVRSTTSLYILLTYRYTYYSPKVVYHQILHVFKLACIECMGIALYLAR